MDKLFLLGSVSLCGLLVMFVIGNAAMTGTLVYDNAINDLNWLNEFEGHDTGIAQGLGIDYQKEKYLLLNITPQPEAAEQQAGTTGIRTMPAREWLLPDAVAFEVDRIPIYETAHYGFMPLTKERIHTYSGSAGYYEEDPREFLHAYLCAQAYRIKGALARCEEVELNYIDDKIIFARDYAEDEYIASQALGTDFAAFFILASQKYGILAAGPKAHLKWTK